jgi:hypothetical protein
MNISEFSNTELISFYRDILKELKNRQVIRTNNFIGEIGEYLVIEFYNNTKGCPKLQAVPPSTKNIDAIGKDGERYSIKCTTRKTTSVFYGINHKDSREPQKQLFEYVIIISLNTDLEINLILEINWELFLKYKYWHSRMKAWNIHITNALIGDAKVLYKRESILRT